MFIHHLFISACTFETCVYPSLLLLFVYLWKQTYPHVSSVSEGPLWCSLNEEMDRFTTFYVDCYFSTTDGLGLFSDEEELKNWNARKEADSKHTVLKSLEVLHFITRQAVFLLQKHQVLSHFSFLKTLTYYQHNLTGLQSSDAFHSLMVLFFSCIYLKRISKKSTWYNSAVYNIKNEECIIHWL